MIFSPALRVATAGAAAACLLVLPACSGSASTGSGSTTVGSGGTETSAGTETPVETPGVTETGTTQTQSPTESPTQSAPPPPATALDPVEAKAALGRAYTSLVAARSLAGKPAATARAKAFSGQQLKVAQGEALQRSVVDPSYNKPDAGAASTPALLLALSTAQSPHKLVLAEGQPAKKALPELYLLEAAGEAATLRVTHVARMLPNRRLQKLQPPVDGTPEVLENAKVRGITPRQLLAKYMAYMEYPEPVADINDQPFIDDPYIRGVEQASRATANKIGANGSYTMKNILVPGSIRALKRQDGALIVFAHFQRMETMKVANGTTLTAPARWKAVNPKLGTIHHSATLRTDVAFAFYMYPYKKAELLAGSEQLVAASGG